MLPSLSRTGLHAGRRIVVALCLLGAAILSLPIVRLDAEPAPTDAGGDTRAGAKASGDPNEGGSVEDSENRAVASTRQNASSGTEYFPRPNKDEEKIIKALDKATTVEFLDLPLEDCITFVKEYQNIPIYVDRNSLTEAQIKLDAPVTLKMQGARLESVLNLLLGPVQLEFLVEDDVLKIMTRAQAQKRFFTRTYPVRDLCQERAEQNKVPDPLMSAITDTIDPDSWSELSGNGELRFVKKTESLVIRQTWSVHRKIVQLLRDLREAKQMEAAKTE
jgi:hypothetical protein